MIGAVAGASKATLAILVALAAALLAVVGGGSLSTATAVAAPKNIGGFIGGPISSSGGGFFPGGRDVAVYTADTPNVADDKLFVVEGFSGSSRVQRLDGHGNFELLWGRDVIRPGFPGNSGTGFEICTAALTGAAGCGSGETPGDKEGELDRPTGIAVDQGSGQVYVVDTANRRVQVFDSNGQFLRAWGWGVDTGAPAFEVCTNSCQAGRTGQGEGDANAGQFANIGSSNTSVNTIAVSPTAPHDIFVTDAGNQRILQFEADGTFIRGWGFDVSPGGGNQFETCESAPPGCQDGATPGSADGQFAGDYPRHVAVDGGGMVYAADSADGERLIRFDSEPAPAVATPVDVDALPSAGLLGDGRTTGMEVDSDTGNLLVVRDRSASGKTRTEVREIANPDADFAPGPPDPILAETHVFVADADDAPGIPTKSLGFDPGNGNIYLVAGLFNPIQPGGRFTGCPGPDNFCLGLIALASSAGPMTASLDAPANVGATAVSLEGSVDPAGGVARYRFQVSDDGTNWEDASQPRYVAGSGDVSVSAQVVGLEPATMYRARVLITKQAGLDATESGVSSEGVFLTDAKVPRVRTLGTAQRTEDSVRLRGLVDPEGTATTYRFEYGPAGGSFDNHVPIPDAQAGSGNADALVIQDVSGLEPITAYHYRIVATSAAGTATGDAVTFTTKAQSTVPPAPNRAYELVSPAEKVSGVGVGIWYTGPASASFVGFNAYDAERFAVQGTWGATLIDGEYSYANDWALAERTPQGWVSSPLASRRSHGSQPIMFVDPSAVTPDLSLSSWHSTTLKLFAEQELWAKEIAGEVVALREWESGRWEVLGTTDDDQGGGVGISQAVAAAADGRSMVAQGALRGLTGAADPSFDLAPGVPSVFLYEVPDGGLSDTFPGNGARSVVNVCTQGTAIPAVLGSGRMSSQPCLGAPERQTVAVDATGGTFTLAFDGQTTAAVAFDASAASLEAALEALPNLEPDDVSVHWGPRVDRPTKPHIVRFDRTLGDVPDLVADDDALVGDGAAAIVQTIPVEPVIDPRGATIDDDVEGTISADGSRIFFHAPNELVGEAPCSGTGAATACPPQLYIRQRGNDGDVVTRWISRSEVTEGGGATADQDASLTAPVVFEGASSDGDKTFFRTSAPLTADDRNGEGQAPPPGGVVSGSASGSSWDLYMYDMPDTPGADPADGDLTRISAGPQGDGDCNGGGATAGALRFVSRDGSLVYFACSGALDGVPVAGDGTITSPDGDPSDQSASNLYLYDASKPLAHRWRFVAKLPRSSELGRCATESTARGAQLGPAHISSQEASLFDAANCMRGTDDGSILTFWTDGRLVDDDPDSVTGDIYAYDAVKDELTRVSAVQDGLGGSYGCAPASSSVRCYGDGGVGGSSALPKLGVGRDANGVTSVFFQSRSRLVLADRDSAYDVYQWRDGRLSLISTGDSATQGAMYIGNDRTGKNVYFATRDRLTWQDHDSVLDIYTARVGDGIPEPPAAEQCDLTLDQCQDAGDQQAGTQIDSDSDSGGNPVTPPRVRLELRTPSARALSRAARTGSLPVRLTSTGDTDATLSAKAHFGGRVRRAASAATYSFIGRKTVVLRLRLSQPARRKLKRSGRLRLALSARAPGARADTAIVVLRRHGST